MLGHLCNHDPAEEPNKAHHVIHEVVNAVKEKGTKKGMEELIPYVIQDYVHEFRLPDWVLPFKTRKAKPYQTY